MTLPLDADGFLRRECPTCEREFKWLSSPASDASDTEAQHAVGIRYYCPYCGVQAPDSAWHTKAQIASARAIVMRVLVVPQLDELERKLDLLNRSPGGLIKLSAKLERDEPEPQPTLVETDDMRRTCATCHPAQPVKVLDDWTGTLFCLICGSMRPARD